VLSVETVSARGGDRQTFVCVYVHIYKDFDCAKRSEVPILARTTRNLFLVSKPSRPSVETIEPPIQRVTGNLSIRSKRPGCEIDYSASYSVEVKSEWSYNSMTCEGKRLPIPFMLQTVEPYSATNVVVVVVVVVVRACVRVCVSTFNIFNQLNNVHEPCSDHFDVMGYSRNETLNLVGSLLA
jgi:hypothetical protein